MSIDNEIKILDGAISAIRFARETFTSDDRSHEIIYAVVAGVSSIEKSEIAKDTVLSVYKALYGSDFTPNEGA